MGLTRRCDLLETYIEKTFDLKGDVMVLSDSDFSMEVYDTCDYREFLIKVSFEDEALFDPIFYCFLREHGMSEQFEATSEFLWAASVLHEIGHCSTLADFNEEDRANSSAVINLLSAFYSDDYEDIDNIDLFTLKKSCYAYWSVPTEFDAQMFVVDIVNRCPQIIEDLIQIYYILREEE